MLIVAALISTMLEAFASERCQYLIQGSLVPVVISGERARPDNKTCPSGAFILIGPTGHRRGVHPEQTYQTAHSHQFGAGSGIYLSPDVRFQTSIQQ